MAVRYTQIGAAGGNMAENTEPKKMAAVGLLTATRYPFPT